MRGGFVTRRHVLSAVDKEAAPDRRALPPTQIHPRMQTREHRREFTHARERLGIQISFHFAKTNPTGRASPRQLKRAAPHPMHTSTPAHRHSTRLHYTLHYTPHRRPTPADTPLHSTPTPNTDTPHLHSTLHSTPHRRVHPTPLHTDTRTPTQTRRGLEARQSLQWERSPAVTPRTPPTPDYGSGQSTLEGR